MRDPMNSFDVREATSGAGGRVASVALDASERSFWIGLSVVVLSLISAFLTYLILTGLTPIVPSRGVGTATTDVRAWLSDLWPG